jgi:hypothetical protein
VTLSVTLQTLATVGQLAEIKEKHASGMVSATCFAAGLPPRGQTMDMRHVDKELIALLPPEERSDGRQLPTVLVRFADGRMAIEELRADAAQVLRPAARFRRSHPILDPETREVIGYEMEQVFLARTA